MSPYVECWQGMGISQLEFNLGSEAPARPSLSSAGEYYAL